MYFFFSNYKNFDFLNYLINWSILYFLVVKKKYSEVENPVNIKLFDQHFLFLQWVRCFLGGELGGTI